jgi:hypothetical protein
MSIESPPYSQSTPAPSYSAEPLENEERLEYTSRPRRHRLPTGKFTLSSGTITLVLNEQDSDASVPLYRQNGLVCGSVSIENCRNVASVSLKLEGRLQRSSTKNSSDLKRFVSEKYTIWPDLSRQPCPPVHEFAFLFPPTYKTKGRTRPLPPSYSVTLPGGFAARCVYSLSVIITKSSSRLAFLGKSQTYGLFLYQKAILLALQSHDRLGLLSTDVSIPSHSPSRFALSNRQVQPRGMVSNIL